MKKQFLPFLFLLVLSMQASMPTFAQDESPLRLNSEAPLENDVLGCALIQDRKIYSEKGYDDFKMLIEGKDEWLYRTRLDLKYRFKLTNNTLDSFYRLNEAFKSYGTNIVLAMMPTRGITTGGNFNPPYDKSYDALEAYENYQILLDELRTTNFTVADTSGVNEIRNYFYPKDNHWATEGARSMAKSVANEIKKFDSYKDIPKKKFKSVLVESKGKHFVPNQYEEVINKICGLENKETQLSQYYNAEEVQSGEALDESSLFGDTQEPDVVIIGTSNSTSPGPSYANFEGFLKEELSVDIANEAISGGSLPGSITSYLLSGRYKNKKPKIMIWEMSAYYGYNQQDFFRELIPSIYGQCSDSEALKKTSVILSGDENEISIFENIKELGLKDHNSYVFLEFEDKETRNIKVLFKHDGGYRDTVSLKRDKRSFPTSNGEYFAEIGNVIETPVNNIIVSAKGSKGVLKAKICKTPINIEKRDDFGDQNQIDLNATNNKNKKEPFWKKLFHKNNIEIKEYEPVEEKAIELPSLTGFTNEEILKKIPTLEDGLVEISKMELQHPLRKFAFNQRLIEMRRIQDRIQPLAIHLRSGRYDFASLREKLKDTNAIVDTKDGYLLRYPIALYPETSLEIRDLDKPLLLSQDRGAFIATVGNLFIINSEVTAWNEKKKAPATLNEEMDDFRPFITTWDGSELYISKSIINNLGYGASKSYGITISSNDVVQEEFFEEFGDLKAPTGWIIDSEFNNMYFGFYSYEAKDFVIYKNKYKDNLIYGIDPHDYSERLIIANNHVQGTKKKHGIIISREVNNSFIINNISEYNAGSGIMLDRLSSHNIVANNVARFNEGDGITLYESPYNVLINNDINHNGIAGMRIRNSWDINVMGGSNSLNKGQAFIVYQDDLLHTSRDFKLDPVTPRSAVDIKNVSMESNGGVIKGKSFAEISMSDIDLDKASLSSLDFSGALKPINEEIHEFYEKNGAIRLVNEDTVPEPSVGKE